MKLDKKKLCDAIRALPEWDATQKQGFRSGEDVWTFHVFEAFGAWFVLDFFDSKHETERVFHIWNGEKLRRATEFEDAILRAYDDAEPLLEQADETSFLLSMDEEAQAGE